jgi:ParB-like chromosome segregation protein Spo0J
MYLLSCANRPIINLSGPEETPSEQSLDEALALVRDFLTKEELLYISLYKNAPRVKNSIYRVFLQKYRGKTLSNSAISMQKKRIFKVLFHISNLLNYKQKEEINQKLRDALTEKQYRAWCLYEKRKQYPEKELKISESTYMGLIKLAKRNILAKNDKVLNKYLILLKEVFKFSRKFLHIKIA